MVDNFVIIHNRKSHIDCAMSAEGLESTDVPCMATVLESEQPQKRQRKLPASLLAPPTASASASGALTSHMHGDRMAHQPPPAKALQFRGRIQLAKTEAEAIWMMGMLLIEKPSAVGFDIEWRVSYETGFPPRKIALIQISSAT